MGWVASLGGKVQPKTIKSYLTHVHSMHTDLDLPFSAVESPIVQCLICGIKRYHGERDRRLKQPITLPILRQLLGQLRPETKAEDVTTYAACCLAYSTLLCCGEFISRSGTFDPSLLPSRRVVQFIPSFENPTHIILTLPASKTV